MALYSCKLYYNNVCNGRNKIFGVFTKMIIYRQNMEIMPAPSRLGSMNIFVRALQINQMVSGQNVDGQNVDGQNVDNFGNIGQNVDGQNVDGQKKTITIINKTQPYSSQFMHTIDINMHKIYT